MYQSVRDVDILGTDRASHLGRNETTCHHGCDADPAFPAARFAAFERKVTGAAVQLCVDARVCRASVVARHYEQGILPHALLLERIHHSAS